MYNKKNKKSMYIATSDLNELQKQYTNKLETSPEFSLEVDPEGKYRMSDEQKKFIQTYIQFKNIPLTCQLTGVSEEKGKAYYLAYESQLEIRRINLAMYHRQFSNKLLDLDEIGGWLSSVLVDEVPIADRLQMKDKLKVAQMIIDLNNLKRTAFSDPSVIDTVEVSEQIKDLSVKSIKRLIEETNNPEKSIKNKEEIIEKIDSDNNLSGEEIAYLRTLPVEKLLELLEEKGSN